MSYTIKKGGGIARPGKMSGGKMSGSRSNVGAGMPAVHRTAKFLGFCAPLNVGLWFTGGGF